MIQKKPHNLFAKNFSLFRQHFFAYDMQPDSALEELTPNLPPPPDEPNGKEIEAQRDAKQEAVDVKTKDSTETLAEELDMSPDELKETLLHFQEGEYENSADEAEHADIFKKIRTAKEANKLPHLDTTIVASTDGTGYNIDRIKKQPLAWHTAKKAAFETLLKAKKLEPTETQQLIGNQQNRDLITQYISKVKEGKTQAEEFLANNEAEFLEGATLLDLATNFQRAMELRAKIETKPFDPENESLILKLESAQGQEYRYATLKGLLGLTLEAQAKEEAAPASQEAALNYESDDLKTETPKKLDLNLNIDPNLTPQERIQVEAELKSGKLTEVINALPSHLRARLYLCPPIICLRDTDIQEWDTGFFFRLDIRKSTAEITQKLRKITTEIIEVKYLKNTKEEEKEHQDDFNKPFKNKRLAYRYFQKGEIIWSITDPKPGKNYEYVAKDSDFNFDIQEKFNPEYGEAVPAVLLPAQQAEMDEKTRQKYIENLENYLQAFNEFEKETDGAGYTKADWEIELGIAKENTDKKFSDPKYTKKWSNFFKKEIALWKKEKAAAEKAAEQDAAQAVEQEHKELEALTEENVIALNKLNDKYGISIFSYYRYDKSEYPNKEDRQNRKDVLTKVKNGIPAFAQALEKVHQNGYMMNRLKVLIPAIAERSYETEKIKNGRYVFHIDPTQSADQMYAYIDQQIDAFIMNKNFLDDDPIHEKAEKEKCEKATPKVPFANSRLAKSNEWIEKRNGLWQPKQNFEWVDPKSDHNFAVYRSRKQNTPPPTPAKQSHAPKVPEKQTSDAVRREKFKQAVGKGGFKEVLFWQSNIEGDDYDYDRLENRKFIIGHAIAQATEGINNQKNQYKTQAMQNTSIVINPNKGLASWRPDWTLRLPHNLIPIDTDDNVKEIVQKIINAVDKYAKLNAKRKGKKPITPASEQKNTQPQTGKQQPKPTPEVQSPPERQEIEAKLKNWNTDHGIKVAEIILAPNETYIYYQYNRIITQINNGRFDTMLQDAIDAGIPKEKIAAANFVISPHSNWLTDTYTYSVNGKKYIVLNQNTASSKYIAGIKKAMNIQ